MASRPPVPAEVQQILRAEAFFGCCRCGFPIYEYHHIVPYETEHHFRPEDMMLLCPNCHDMATKGSLKEPKQRQFKEQPFNRKHGYAKGKLWVDAPGGTILLSSTNLVGQGCFVSVGPTCLVRIEVGDEGNLELYLALYDKTDKLLIDVDRNEWKTGDPTFWDLEADHQFLKLRSKPYDVLLEINAKESPLRVRAQLWYHGTRIDCKPSRIVMDTPNTKGMVIQSGSLRGSRVAVSADGLASGIVPMNVHPDDPLFGGNAVRKKSAMKAPQSELGGAHISMQKQIEMSFQDRRINIDATHFERCTFKFCTLVFSGGLLPNFIDCEMADCNFILDGPARDTVLFCRMLGKMNLPHVVEAIIADMKKPLP